MHQLPDRIAHTTAFVIPVVEHRLEREISQFTNINIWEKGNALFNDAHFIYGYMVLEGGRVSPHGALGHWINSL